MSVLNLGVGGISSTRYGVEVSCSAAADVPRLTVRLGVTTHALMLSLGCFLPVACYVCVCAAEYVARYANPNSAPSSKASEDGSDKMEEDGQQAADEDSDEGFLSSSEEEEQ